MEWLNYLVLGLYLLMMLTVAFLTRNKGKTLNDYLLAGRGLGGWMTAFAYGTTYFSAVVFVGYAGKFGWNFGLAAIWIGVGNAVLGSYLAWKILAQRTRSMTRKLGVKTMPEFFEKRYMNPHIKLFASLLIFIFLIPYSASVYSGLAYLFEAVFGINFIWCVAAMALLTALYLIFGGYFATAFSDFIQGIIMIVGVVVMVVALLLSPEVNGLEGFKFLTENNLGLIPILGNEGIIKSPLFNVIILILLTSFGVWGMPQVIHKFYAIKDDKAIRKATIISTLFALIVGAGAYFVGSMSRLFVGIVGTSPNPDEIVPKILMNILPAGLIGLIMVLVLSASISTLSSLSLAGSSAISVDVYKGYINPKAEDKKVNLLMKICSACFVILSALLAITKFDAIVTLMSLSWGVLAGCFVGPYIYGIRSKKMTTAGAYASLISGLVVNIGLVIAFGLFMPSPNYTGILAVIKGGIANSPLIGVIAMAVSMIITPLVSKLTRKLPKDEVEKMFMPLTDEENK